MAIESINPATGQTLKKFTPHTKAEVDVKLTAAVQAFAKWQQRPVAERAKLIQKMAATLRNDQERLAKLITAEMGRPLAASGGEIEKCAWACEYYAENAETFLADQPVDTGRTASYVHVQPLGAIVAVMPWNFPYWQVLRAAAPALTAGNVMLLKHASNVPQCAMAIEELFEKVGFPDGVFQTLLIGAGEVADIVADDRIAAVTLTGSEPAGSATAATAAKYIKKSVLELGGSDPFVVLEDADVAEAAKAGAAARVTNTGQSCNSAKRFIVHHAVADQFTKRFVEHMRAFKVGDPLDPSTDLGPLARPDLVTQLDRQVRESVKQGAKLLLGGRPIKGPGAYYEATVLTDIKPGMPAHEEELFGPVASIFIVKDADEAVRVANDTRFGLSGSVWTKDLTKGEELAKQLQVGFAAINEAPRSDPRLPFGGVKKSGYGRELGRHGIEEFVNLKTVMVR